ncbi:MAG: hypothetical protein RJA37_1262 [Verrucomicrobiota bacterium]
MGSNLWWWHRAQLIVSDHVVDRRGADVLLRDHVLVADVIVRSGDEEGAADLDLRPAFADDVAGEVLADELVEGLVLIQRADHVVAEGPEVIDDEVPFEAVAFAEAHHVEPAAAPLFAVARRGEQAVDERLRGGLGVLGMGGDEGVLFLRRGWQAGEVVGHARDQRGRSGGRIEVEAVGGQFLADEAVDGGVLELLCQRLKRPPGLVGAFRLGGRLRARVRRAHADPGRQVGEHRVGQLRLLRRHLHVLLQVEHRAQQQAFVGLARDDDRLAGVAAFLPPGLGVEIEAALEFLGLGAVALVAVLGQHWSYLLLEEGDAGRIIGGGGGDCGQQEGGEESGGRSHHLVPELVFAASTSNSLIVKRRLTMEGFSPAASTP